MLIAGRAIISTLPNYYSIRFNTF